MKRVVTCFFLAAASTLTGYDYASFTGEQRALLFGGQSLVWTYEDEAKERQFTCVAAVMDAALMEVWGLIENKELSPTYLNGLEESKVVGQEGDAILIYQETRPTGIAKSFKYVIRHQPVPWKRVEFERVSGDLRHIQGAWHFDVVEAGKKTLLVYELHLDPGRLYPQSFVVRSQKGRLPEVMMEIRKKLAELKTAASLGVGGEFPAQLVN